jgi:hypothetical protein
MSEGALKAILLVVAIYHVVIGGLALLAPDTFFEEIGSYGIQNSHYVGDVGAFFLAFGLAAGIAAFRPSWRASIFWVGAIWYALHAVNHAFDIGEAESEGRGWSDTLLVAFGAFGAAWLARVSERFERLRPSP